MILHVRAACWLNRKDVHSSELDLDLGEEKGGGGGGGCK